MKGEATMSSDALPSGNWRDKAFAAHGGAPCVGEMYRAALDEIDRLQSELTQARENLKRAADETGWLVEIPGFGEPVYAAFSGVKVNRWRLNWPDKKAVGEEESPLVLTKDASDAIRFARKIDAEAFIACFDRWLLHPIATEHSWPLSLLNTPAKDTGNAG